MVLITRVTPSTDVPGRVRDPTSELHCATPKCCGRMRLWVDLVGVRRDNALDDVKKRDGDVTTPLCDVTAPVGIAPFIMSVAERREGDLLCDGQTDPCVTSCELFVVDRASKEEAFALRQLWSTSANKFKSYIFHLYLDCFCTLYKESKTPFLQHTIF